MSHQYKFKNKSTQELDDKTRKEVAELVKAGNHLLWLFDTTKISPNYTLLCIKIIVDFRSQQIQKDLKENGEVVPTPHTGPTSYTLKIEDAVDCLVLYEHFWIRSISIVRENLSELPQSNLQGIGKEVGGQSSSSCTEVILSILINGPVNDKIISKREELKTFLKELKKREVVKVHASCSSVAAEKRNSAYSFLVL